jgi:hypothetical protein
MPAGGLGFGDDPAADLALGTAIRNLSRREHEEADSSSDGEDMTQVNLDSQGALLVDGDAVWVCGVARDLIAWRMNGTAVTIRDTLAVVGLLRKWCGSSLSPPRRQLLPTTWAQVWKRASYGSNLEESRPIAVLSCPRRELVDTHKPHYFSRLFLT